MPYDVVITEQARRELSILIWRIARWARQTMGEREGMSSVERLGTEFKAARDDIAERPLWYPYVNDDSLRKLGKMNDANAGSA